MRAGQRTTAPAGTLPRRTVCPAAAPAPARALSGPGPPGPACPRSASSRHSRVRVGAVAGPVDEERAAVPAVPEELAVVVEAVGAIEALAHCPAHAEPGVRAVAV